MTLNKSYIYALAEKGNKNYRYVGKSVNPEYRIKNHIRYSKLKKTHKDNWIQSVLNRDKTIEFIILEETNNKEWPEREKFWIDKLKKEGFNLTNHNNGGLGGGHIIYKNTFKKTKKWIHENVDAKSAKEWYNFVRENGLPDFIPSNPKEVYLKRGWISWGDLLNTGNKYDNDVDYMSYNYAKKYIKENLKHINTQKEWKISVKNKEIPNSIPNRPNRYYSNKKRGWISWGDFLNTSRIANKNKKFYTYDKSKKWMLNNFPKINSVNKWYKFCKSDDFPNFIPKCPQLTYKEKGWVDWFDFFSKQKNCS